MGIFRTIHSVFSLAFVLVVVVVVYALMLGYTVAKTSVTSTGFSGVTNITFEGFTVQGNVLVQNEGPLTLNVKGIEYELIVEGENRTVANGTIDGFKVPSDSNATFHYSQRVSWNESLALSPDVARGKPVNLAVNGDVVISHFGLYENRIPFKSSFDLTTFLTGLIGEQLGAGAGALASNLTGMLRSHN